MCIATWTPATTTATTGRSDLLPPSLMAVGGRPAAAFSRFMDRRNSDKLLFKSGKYEVTSQAKTVLGKVAAVLKNQPDIEFMVEGHTDNVAYRNGVLIDNWDLSVKRATSVVRILQKEYGLDPKKMSAAGRGEYNPVFANNTAENKAANRRTRIVILPQLDQFFQLLEPKKDPS